MSTPANTQPQQPIGPRQARIKQLWDQIWQCLKDGEVYEPLIAVSEIELANFGGMTPANDQVALADLLAAKNTHLFQSKHFAAQIDKLNSFRDAVLWSREKEFRSN